MFKRTQTLPLSSQHSCFLWGARQTGKSTLLKQLFPSAYCYNLLLSDVYNKLISKPELMREELLSQFPVNSPADSPIIIDEVQKVPALLDEVHWLIENKGYRFVLCGSSARKLRRSHANLLGGRAIRYELHGITSSEDPDFSMDRAVNNGLLPAHYLAPDPQPLLAAYVGDYLKEEIAAEALTRNIAAFSRFLEAAAFSNGEMISYVTISRDCGISAPTVKAHFEILSDTLLGQFVQPYRKIGKRRLVTTPKFYLFDPGVARFLLKQTRIEPGSPAFGKAFEHVVFCELRSYLAYQQPGIDMTFWRTSSGFEVDFVLGNADAAIEVKATALANDNHLKGLRAIAEEYPTPKRILVSNDPNPRKTSDGIDIWPWRHFFSMLWRGEVV
jgi:predicted AAA+ superfamily ATPase